MVKNKVVLNPRCDSHLLSNILFYLQYMPGFVSCILLFHVSLNFWLGKAPWACQIFRLHCPCFGVCHPTEYVPMHLTTALPILWMHTPSNMEISGWLQEDPAKQRSYPVSRYSTDETFRGKVYWTSGSNDYVCYVHWRFNNTLKSHYSRTPDKTYVNYFTCPNISHFGQSALWFTAHDTMIFCSATL